MNSSENAQVRELEHEASYLGLPAWCIREIQNHLTEAEVVSIKTA